MGTLLLSMTKHRQVELALVLNSEGKAIHIFKDRCRRMTMRLLSAVACHVSQVCRVS